MRSVWYGRLLFDRQRTATTTAAEALPPVVKEYLPPDKGPKPVPEFVVKAGLLAMLDLASLLRLFQIMTLIPGKCVDCLSLRVRSSVMSFTGSEFFKCHFLQLQVLDFRLQHLHYRFLWCLHGKQQCRALDINDLQFIRIHRLLEQFYHVLSDRSISQIWATYAATLCGCILNFGIFESR